MGNKARPYTNERRDRVFELMTRENMNQIQLAEKMGIAQQRVSEFLKTGKISDYYFKKICSAFPEYTEESLDGYGDRLETKVEKKFREFKPQEIDLTNYINATDTEMLFKKLTNNLNKLDLIHQAEVLMLLNQIVEPYTMIKEWENKY